MIINVVATTLLRFRMLITSTLPGEEMVSHSKATKLIQNTLFDRVVDATKFQVQLVTDVLHSLLFASLHNIFGSSHADILSGNHVLSLQIFDVI